MSSPSFFIYTEILTYTTYIQLKYIKFEHMELCFIMQTVGDTLKFIRKSKNLTQQEACTDALSRSNYQKKITKLCLVWTDLFNCYLISI